MEIKRLTDIPSINIYIYGIALMEVPFFFIAHAHEKVTGGYANGFSDSYRNLIRISTLFYGLLGLILTYKILRNYFMHNQSMLGTLCIFLGNNLFWFMLYQAGMAHVPLFFLYALLIYLTIKIHQLPRVSLSQILQ